MSALRLQEVRVVKVPCSHKGGDDAVKMLIWIRIAVLLLEVVVLRMANRSKVLFGNLLCTDISWMYSCGQSVVRTDKR